MVRGCSLSRGMHRSKGELVVCQLGRSSSAGGGTGLVDRRPTGCTDAVRGRSRLTTAPPIGSTMKPLYAKPCGSAARLFEPRSLPELLVGRTCSSGSHCFW